MSTPGTEAGKALLTELRDVEGFGTPWFIGGSEKAELDSIAAIEAEARQQERERLAALVEGLPAMHTHGVPVAPIPMPLVEFRAAVLAILRAEP